MMGPELSEKWVDRLGIDFTEQLLLTRSKLTAGSGLFFSKMNHSNTFHATCQTTIQGKISI